MTKRVPIEQREVSLEDMYRAHMRYLYNTSAGKQGAWLRGRDAVKVPRWFKEHVENLPA